MEKIRIKCTTGITMSLDDMNWFPSKLKKHSDLEIQRIRDSIIEDGFLFPIAIGNLENFFFTFLAFLGMYSISELLMIAMSTCIIETLIALCDTPFLYLAKKISNK